MEEPGLGVPARFDDLGTWVARVSDGRHHYAKTAPWNSDASLVLLLDGWLLDGRTYRRVRRLPLPAEHRTWANSDPHTIYGVGTVGRRPLSWVKVSARTGAMTTLATYRDYRRVSYGKHEGNTDNANRWAVLVGDDVTPFLIEARTGKRRCEVASRGVVSDATMSQDGRHLLVNWDGQGVYAYDLSCGGERRLTGTDAHYDACVLPDGVTQVVVQPARRSLMATRIANGTSFEVYSDSALRIHVSCRNIRRPGWVYVSAYGDRDDRVTLGQRLWQRGFAVRLDGSATVQLFAWLHMPLPAPYDGRPMLVPSPLGDRVWWKVNWDGRSIGVHSFVAGAAKPSGLEAGSGR